MSKHQVGRIFLIRHGEAEHNILNILASWPEKQPYHLTATGRKQVEATANQLSRYPMEVIFTSPQTRTRETAAIIASVCGGVPIIADERLQETQFGILDGRSVSERDARYPRQSMRIETDGSDGVESLTHSMERASAFWRERAAVYHGKNIVIVSHGDPLQMLHGWLMGQAAAAALDAWNPECGEYKVVEWKDVAD